MWKALDATPCARHSKELTRLRCSHCETPICPKCMVQTEVGFKCPTCIQNQQSHLYQVTPLMFGQVLGIGLIVGFVYGYVHPFLMILPIRPLGFPVLGILAAAALGRFVAQRLQQVLHYKRHTGFVWLLLLSFVVGIWLGPFQGVLLHHLGVVQDLSATNAGNILETGSSAIFTWIGLLPDLLLPFLLYDGIKRAFQDK